MTSYKSPPPIAAIQHSRCLLALTVIRACINGIDREVVSHELREHLNSIDTLLDACSKDIRNRKISAGARRDLDHAFVILAEKSDFFKKTGDDLFYAWGCAMWCAMSLHDDCMATCPAYYRGKPWMRLNQALEELCLALEVINPKIGEDGFKIYEKVAL